MMLNKWRPIIAYAVDHVSKASLLSSYTCDFFQHIPVKQLSKRELKIQSKPWITPAIRSLFVSKINYTKNILK